jgi:aminopeptidase N
MWIHESFTAYSENLYVDYHYGKEASSEYVKGTRLNIKNDRPIIGYYDVNSSGSGDMYPKGANMLHTLRQIVDNDSVWRSLLRGLNEEFYHHTVTTQQIENYLDERIDANLAPFFDQYLRDVRIPVFEYAIIKGQLQYRWANVVEGFEIPIFVNIKEKKQILQPTTQWSRIEIADDITEIRVDEDFYMIPFEVTKF